MQKKTARILSVTPVRIPAGGTAGVQIGVPATTPMGKLQFELSEPPEGISIQSVSPIRQATEIVLRSDAAKVKPGLKGNLILNVFAERTSAPESPAPQRNARRVPVGVLPAIPFEIVAE